MTPYRVDAILLSYERGGQRPRMVKAPQFTDVEIRVCFWCRCGITRVHNDGWDKHHTACRVYPGYHRTNRTVLSRGAVINLSRCVQWIMRKQLSRLLTASGFSSAPASSVICWEHSSRGTARTRTGRKLAGEFCSANSPTFCNPPSHAIRRSASGSGPRCRGVISSPWSKDAEGDPLPAELR